MNSEVKRFNYYLSNIMPKLVPYNLTDKEQCIGNYVSYDLMRLQSMFKYKDLPDTIPKRSMELYFMINGHAAAIEHKGDLYVVQGGLGGEPNPYYMPTKYVVANPALKLSKTFTIDEDCVVGRNDSMYYGLMPLLTRYATLATETDISLNIANINLRLTCLISAPDDRTKENGDAYIKRIVDGELAVMAENPFLEGIRVQPYGDRRTETITDLIELTQYLKASKFNDLGLNANYNMKRESLNAEESQMNNDALLPLIDDMLACRQEFCDKVNKMFGTNISVEFNSSWKDNQEEHEAQLKAIENDVSVDKEDRTDEIQGGEKDDAE